MRHPTTTTLPRLTLRFVMTTALVLSLAQIYGERLTSYFVPSFRAALERLQDDFAIIAVDSAHGSAGTVVRVRADFAHPLYVAGRVVYPMNANPRTAGWMQIELTTGGILQYLIMVAIVVLAWPRWSIAEYLTRIALGITLGALLTGFAAVSTGLAELWFPVHADLAPDEIWPLLVWSRFLMGGGGLALALVLAGLAILVAARLPRRDEPNAQRQHCA